MKKTLSHLSLNQKVGQLLIVGIDGSSLTNETIAMMKQSHAGGVLLFKKNLPDLTRSAKLLNGLKRTNAANSQVPLFISIDQEGGKVSRLPSAFTPMPANAVIGKTGKSELAKRMGQLIARQLKLLGFNVDFAPVLDINSNPKNPVIGDRSFGSTPALVASMGIAEIEGLRGGGVVPVVKHFPGHGDTAVDSHVDLPVVRKTEKQLSAFEWDPFRKAAHAGAEAVMVAHILYPNVDAKEPASLSSTVIQGWLRQKLGFRGVVFTDDLTMGAIAKRHNVGEAAVIAVKAGADAVIIGHEYDNVQLAYRDLLASVRKGELTQARIDESVSRILMLKYKYRLTDAPVPIPQASDLPNAAIGDWLRDVEAAEGK